MAGFTIVIGEYTLSVQFGPHNYCGNYGSLEGYENIKAPKIHNLGHDRHEFTVWEKDYKSDDAEIAIFRKGDGERKWMTREIFKEIGLDDPGDDVVGYQDATRVGCVITYLTQKVLDADGDEGEGET